MKKDMQVVFQALLEKLISVIYYENPNPQNLLLTLESQKKMEPCKSVVVTKT